MLRLLKMKRYGNTLIVTVKWLRSPSSEPYSLVEIGVDGLSVSWRDFPTFDVARKAFATAIGNASTGGKAVCP